MCRYESPGSSSRLAARFVWPRALHSCASPQAPRYSTPLHMLFGSSLEGSSVAMIACHGSVGRCCCRRGSGRCLVLASGVWSVVGVLIISLPHTTIHAYSRPTMAHAWGLARGAFLCCCTNGDSCILHAASWHVAAIRYSSCSRVWCRERESESAQAQASGMRAACVPQTCVLSTFVFEMKGSHVRCGHAVCRRFGVIPQAKAKALSGIQSGRGHIGLIVP